MAASRHYRVLTHLADGRVTVAEGNGHPFTKHAATRFARLQARAPANVTRVDIQSVETVATIVPPAVARAQAASDDARRLAS